MDWHTISQKIDDLFIKTIISIEPNLRQYYHMYIPYRNSCYEIFGFDILIDQFLNPWLLEVNLSPSLNCDSPLDQKIKGELIAESLNIARIISIDKREKENEAIKNYFNEIDAKVIKDTSHIEIMKNFKITKEIKEMIWETDEEHTRYQNY